MLTAQQQRLLEFIQTRLDESGVSPSFDEMKDALGLKSKSGIHRLIKGLEERGFIKRLANRARALEIVKLPEAMIDHGTASETAQKPGTVIKADFIQSLASGHDTENAFDIPLHGRIAAGTPIEAIENVDSYVTVPADVVGRGTCFALVVSGDSMIEKGIIDGDTVVIERCKTARDGEIVVALVEGEEATLKIFQPKGRHVALIPANRDYATQVYSANQVEIQGRLVGLMRQYH